jgi:uncharacterized RDD family membrane protein YckC
MNCSVCNRNNAVTLSICPACGAMINDTVREELVGKISAPKTLDFELKGNKMTQAKINQSAKSVASQKLSAEVKTATTEIASKATSPTLVEFHNKNAAIPEWRLQLQNVVRQRQEREAMEVETEAAQPVQLITNGANALKAEPVPEPVVYQHKNPTLNSALERIEKSRQQFLEKEMPTVESPAPPLKANKNYPFYIAPKTSDAVSKLAEINPPVNSFAKPKLATSLRNEKEKLDTNKLPPIPKPAPIATSFESYPVISDEIKPVAEEILEAEIKSNKTPVNKIEPIEINEDAAAEEIEIEEFDDNASFAMRFNAGLFDLIIGSFTSLFLLSPFMLLGGNWLSTAGAFAFLATCAVVMFVYQTTAIGLYGRTFGMRLFSLEIIDIETEDFPSLHQAAVSSAVYLLSLALAGCGFISVFFNEDKRAVHDLLSGTIVIKED